MVTLVSVSVGGFPALAPAAVPGSDAATAVGVSPDGADVFVTGSDGSTGYRDYATLAYSAA